MPRTEDVMKSLGFLALQAEQQDLQRQQHEAFQAKQEEDQRNAVGFDRMTQMLGMLDQRRQASHDRDMEVAKLAGTAGVDINPAQDEDVKGMARIGKSLKASEERKQAAELASKEAIQRLTDTRIRDLNKANNDIRVNAQIDAMDKADKDRASRDNAALEAADRADKDRVSRERIAARNNATALKVAELKKAGGSGTENGLDKITLRKLEEDAKETNSMRAELNGALDALNGSESLSEDLGTFRGQGKTLTTKLKAKLHLPVSEADTARLQRVNDFETVYSRLKNVLIRARSGTAVNPNEMQRIDKEVGDIANDPLTLRQKALKLQAILNDVVTRIETQHPGARALNTVDEFSPDEEALIQLGVNE